MDGLKNFRMHHLLLLLCLKWIHAFTVFISTNDDPHAIPCHTMPYFIKTHSMFFSMVMIAKVPFEGVVQGAKAKMSCRWRCSGNITLQRSRARWEDCNVTYSTVGTLQCNIQRNCDVAVQWRRYSATCSRLQCSMELAMHGLYHCMWRWTWMFE